MKRSNRRNDVTAGDLRILLNNAEKRGLEMGVKLMQQRMLLACENGTPIEINGKAYFVQDAIANLRNIIDSLGEDKRI